MEIISKIIELKAPKGIERLIVSQNPEKGWLLRFSIKKEAGWEEECYTMTNSYVIYGVFIAMGIIPKMPDSNYMWKGLCEEQVLDIVKGYTTADYKEWANEAVTEDPILTEIKNAMK